MFEMNLLKPLQVSMQYLVSEQCCTTGNSEKNAQKLFSLQRKRCAFLSVWELHFFANNSMHSILGLFQFKFWTEMKTMQNIETKANDRFIAKKYSKYFFFFCLHYLLINLESNTNHFRTITIQTINQKIFWFNIIIFIYLQINISNLFEHKQNIFISRYCTV